MDEAHERNVNTDVLLGMLSRALPIRQAQSELETKTWNKLSDAEKLMYHPPIKPLKLVIMSATLRIDDFLTPRLFPITPPIIKVEARQFPVTPHFSRRTELDNYVKEAYRKVLQIHRKLPEGGILVFLTGKREIMHFTRRLNKHFDSRNSRVNSSINLSESWSKADTSDAPGIWDTEEEQQEAEEDRNSAPLFRGNRNKRGKNNDASDFGSTASFSDDEESDSEWSDIEDDVDKEIDNFENASDAAEGDVATGSDERKAMMQALLKGGGIMRFVKCLS